jgi:flagellin
MKAALKAVGDALNVTNILMDSLDNIYDQMYKIKEATSNAASGALGTSERVALAKAAYRLAQQIQTVADSTVFGGRQLLSGSFSADFVIGTDGANNLLTLAIDMTTNNIDFNVESNNFNMNAMNVAIFGGITNLDMREFNNVSAANLGIFSDSALSVTLTSISNAIDNINKAAAYLGGVANRMFSQEDLLKSQVTNYNAAISRIQDADIALEQLQLIKSQFLQQASLISLAQANANPQSFLQLLQG